MTGINLSNTENEVSTNKGVSPSILLVFSLITMGISLFILSFISYTEPYTGRLTLLMGLLFGWAVPLGGLAVYANLFYLYIVFKIGAEKPPIKATVIMLLLASTTFLFDCVPHSAGCSAVYSWGWGAILWGMSILSLALAIFAKTRGKSKKVELIILVCLLSVTLLPTSIYHFYQINLANEQEREKYLSTGVAFTVVELANIPYTPPTSAVTFNKSTVVAIDGQVDIEGMRVVNQNFAAHLPNIFQHDNIFWRVFPAEYRGGYIALLDEPKLIDYYYGIRQKSPQRAEMFIKDANHKTLWQADVIEKNDRYYPSYGRDLFNLFRPIFTGNLHAKHTIWRGNGHNKQQFNEKTDKHCPFVMTKNTEENTRFVWNQQKIQVDNYYGRLQEQAFCSENYGFLLFVRSYERKNTLPSLNLIVFERHTMLPLWHFNKDNRAENDTLTAMLTHYQNHQTLGAINAVELIPEKSKEESPTKKWQPIKVVLHVDGGTIVLTKENYF